MRFKRFTRQNHVSNSPRMSWCTHRSLNGAKNKSPASSNQAEEYGFSHVLMADDLIWVEVVAMIDHPPIEGQQAADAIMDGRVGNQRQRLIARHPAHFRRFGAGGEFAAAIVSQKTENHQPSAQVGL